MPLREATKARWDLRQWIALAAILSAALYLRLDNFVGMTRLDMFRYSELSHHVVAGGSLFTEGVFYAARRLTLLLPLFASNALFGWGEHVSTAWPLACSLATVVFMFLLARELWGPIAGVVAGAGAAFAPIEVELATQLLPDPVMMPFVIAAVFFAVVAVRRDQHWRGYALLAGVALGAAYFARVNALLFFPLVLSVGLVLDPSRWRRPLWSLVGFTSVLAIVAGGFWIIFGDPVIDWRRFAEFVTDYADTGFIQRETTFWALLQTTPSLTWIVPTAAVAVVVLLLMRSFDRGALLVLLWGLGWFVYLDVLSPLQGLDTSYRYAAPLAVPTILLAAAALAGIYGAGEWNRRAAIGLGIATLMAASITPARLAIDNWVGNHRWTSVREAAKRLPDEEDLPVFVTDRLNLYALNYYSRYVLDRDTILPPDDPRNAGARLFATFEQTPPEDRPYVLLTYGFAPEGSASETLTIKPHRPGQRLRLYRVDPRPETDVPD